MVYKPTEWKNREVEKPRTFIIQDNGDGTITLIPEEGHVAEPGTPIAATFMNKIEQGIANAIPSGEKGKPNGIPTLDATGKVPSSQLNVTQPPDATTSIKGIVQLNESLNSTNNTQAATPSAVKSVNDKFISEIVAIGSRSAAITLGPRSVSVGKDAYAVGDKSSAIGVGAYVVNPNEGFLGEATTNGTYKWIVVGSLSVEGAKNFEMPHPAPHKKATHRIRHGAVESPTAGDTLYRYHIEATADGETVEVQLPDYFQYLNKDVDVWVNGHKQFGRGFGEVVEDKLFVTCEKVGLYNVLVIGTRNDDHESISTWGLKGVEREIGESWTGETYSFEVDELTEITEFGEVAQ